MLSASRSIEAVKCKVALGKAGKAVSCPVLFVLSQAWLVKARQARPGQSESRLARRVGLRLDRRCPLCPGPVVPVTA